MVTCCLHDYVHPSSLAHVCCIRSCSDLKMPFSIVFFVTSPGRWKCQSVAASSSVTVRGNSIKSERTFNIVKSRPLLCNGSCVQWWLGDRWPDCCVCNGVLRAYSTLRHSPFSSDCCWLLVVVVAVVAVGLLLTRRFLVLPFISCPSLRCFHSHLVLSPFLLTTMTHIPFIRPTCLAHLLPLPLALTDHLTD